MINLCDSQPCINRGGCRPLLLNYTCECLAGSYSGRHCEMVTGRMILLSVASKSVAYIAIIAIVSVATFIVVMDILKYCFGIDPVEEERQRIRRKRWEKRRKRPVIQRFTYVNAPMDSSTEPFSTVKITTI